MNLTQKKKMVILAYKIINESIVLIDGCHLMAQLTLDSE